MPPDNLKRLHRHPYRYALITGMILILAGATALYSMGYRPGPGLTFVRTGSVVIKGVPAGGVMYVDDLRRTTSTGSDVSLPLVPGDHTLIIDVSADYPWSDIVSIQAKKDTVSQPILIAKNPQKALLSQTDAAKADSQFAATTLPDATHPLRIANGCAQVTVQGNQIIVSLASSSSPTSASATTSAAPCTPPPYLCVNNDCSPAIIFSPTRPLTSVILYPGRTDALIVSYGDLVAALEIDPEKPQYFAPIQEGAAATIIPDTSGGTQSVLMQTAGHDYRLTL